MFLTKWEGGEMMKQATISNDDLQNADDGYLEIYDITDPDNPKEYCSGQWLSIDTEMSE